MGLHVIGRTSHQQPCLGCTSLQRNGDTIRIVVPKRSKHDILSFGRSGKRYAHHHKFVINNTCPESGIYYFRTIIWMTPLSHSLHRYLQGSIWRTRCAILLTEYVCDIGIIIWSQPLLDKLTVKGWLVDGCCIGNCDCFMKFYIGQPNRFFHGQHLMLFGSALYIAIEPPTHIHSQHNLQGFAEMLINLYHHFSTHTAVGIGEIRCIDRSMIPR